MPTTYNGIGTRYYGSSNVQTRPDVCQFCHRSAQLKSYDTRLWFVIVYIPVIPLGRKRILDFCPLCTRHRVFALGEWEKLKQKNISEATAGMQASPQDPKAAIKLHSALAAFGQFDEAGQVAQLMKNRFGQDAETLAYLGDSLQFYGKHAEALPFFEQALRLNPDLPQARVAVGLGLIDQKRLDEARKLLQFLEAPGNTKAPGALYALAVGYQDANRHTDALQLFKLISERFPKLAQDKAFRKAVKKSEAAAGVRDSTLPPRQINWMRTMALIGVPVVALLGLFGSNYYLSQHRTLHLVSGLAQPATVEIAGRGQNVVPRHGEISITLPEGDYEATVTGGAGQKISFKIHSTFLGRWFGKPVDILNVNGSALLILDSTTYAVNPTAGVGSFSFYYGEPFLHLAHVDYPFESFPEKIELSSETTSIQKNRIDLSEYPPRQAFLMLAGRSRYPEALKLAEWDLRLHPDDTELISYYVLFGQIAQRDEQVRAFVAEAVKRRPIEIEWHRVHQEMAVGGAQSNAVVTAEYESLLQGDPENSALLYLRGRLCPGKSQSVPLYKHALVRDPSNYFAHAALGHTYCSSGDWASAIPELAEAVRLQPANRQFTGHLFDARMALGEFSALETGLRAALAKKPLDRQLLAEIAQVLAAEQKPGEWEKIAADSRQRFQTDGEDPDAEMQDLQAAFLYASGQFDALEKLSPGKKAAAKHAPSRFQALVELGRLSEAADFQKALPARQQDPFDLLALSVAFQQTGDSATAAATRSQAIKILAAGRPEYVAASELLMQTDPPKLDELADVELPPASSAMLLVVEGQRFPALAAKFYPAARRLNATRQFPFHLIDRVTQDSSTAKTQSQ